MDPFFWSSVYGGSHKEKIILYAWESTTKRFAKEEQISADDSSQAVTNGRNVSGEGMFPPHPLNAMMEQADQTSLWPCRRWRYRYGVKLGRLSHRTSVTPETTPARTYA